MSHGLMYYNFKLIIFITCAFDVSVASEGTMIAACLMENRVRFFILMDI